jgi:hypothetical protein
MFQRTGYKLLPPKKILKRGQNSSEKQRKMKKEKSTMGTRLIKEQRILLGFLQFLAQRMAEEMEQK